MVAKEISYFCPACAHAMLDHHLSEGKNESLRLEEDQTAFSDRMGFNLHVAEQCLSLCIPLEDEELTAFYELAQETTRQVNVSLPKDCKNMKRAVNRLQASTLVDSGRYSRIFESTAYDKRLKKTSSDALQGVSARRRLMGASVVVLANECRSYAGYLMKLLSRHNLSRSSHDFGREDGRCQVLIGIRGEDNELEKAVGIAMGYDEDHLQDMNAEEISAIYRDMIRDSVMICACRKLEGAEERAIARVAQAFLVYLLGRGQTGCAYGEATREIMQLRLVREKTRWGNLLG